MKRIVKVFLAIVFCLFCIGTASCKINNSVDVKSLEFLDETYVYDGQSHSLKVTGLPEGVNVIYQNNDKILAGKYEVVAELEDTTGKFNVPDRLTATLTITKKVLTIDDFVFESKELTYDGKIHSLEVVGLPTGVTVSYENNGKIDAGTYEVIAKLEDTTGNYEIPDELKAILTIFKKEYDSNVLAFDSKEVVYDGETHSLEVVGLPEGVNVSYENNGKIDAGTYEVIAKLEDTTGNYEIPNELKAILTIAKKEYDSNVLAFDSKEVVYDGETHSLEVVGLPEGVNVSYENNGKIDAGTYEVVAKLEDTTGNYEIPNELKAILTIAKKEYDSNALVFDSKEVVYDGETHSLEVVGLPTGVTVSYENNGKIDAGTYEVVAKLEDTTGNYEIPNELKATLKINKKDLTSDIEFVSKKVTYDGETHSLEVVGLPTGVTVSYENNGKTNVGTYEVVAKLEDTTGNYIVPSVLNSTITIEKIKILLVNNKINLKYTSEELEVIPLFTNLFKDVSVSYNLQMEDDMIKEAKTYLINVNVLNDIYQLEDSLLTVIVEKELFTITFKNENYNDKVYEVYFGDDLVLNNPPFEKVGYNPIYDIELTELVNVRSNKVVNVSFEAMRFKLTYNLGIDTSEDKTIDVYYDQEVTLSYLNLLGYKFIGYAEDDSSELKNFYFTYKYLDDVKLYAKYKCIYTYTINSYNNGATITGLDSDNLNIKDLNILEYIYAWKNNICTKHEVISIGSQAFYNNKTIETISIPKTIKSINDKAFYGCSNVHLINYDAPNITNSSTTTYISNNIGSKVYDTKGLKLIIGENVESIPSYFMDSSYITEIYAFDAVSLKNIGNYAFSGLTYLTNITLPNSIESIGDYAFSNCKSMELDMSVLTNLKTIGTYAFNQCKALESIIIGENVTSIGKSTFNGCTNVKTINYLAINLVNSSTITVGDSSLGLKLIIGEKVENIPSYIFSDGDTILDSAIFEIDASNAKNLKTIGEYAFYNITTLKSVSLSESLEEIGDYAFDNCKNMELDMSVLTNLKTIGTYAFYLCKALESIIIGENVTSIGKYAFKGCANVNSIYYYAKKISNTTTTSVIANDLGENVYQTKGLKLVIGSKVETIPNYFMDNSYLTEIDALNSAALTSIGNYAFNAATLLTTVKLSDSIENIGDYAFSNCKSMELDMSVLTGLKTIGEYAFSQCKTLDNITIGENMTSLGKSAFSSCYNVKTINYLAINLVNSSKIIVGDSSLGLKLVIGEKVENIPSYMFSDGNMSYSYITEIDASNAKNLKTIGENAFYNITTLKSVSLSESLEEIGDYAFGNCKNMELDMSVLTNLKTIGSHAFYLCKGLVNITFGEKLTTIGEYAFYNCSNIASITLHNSIQTIEEHAFYNCSNLKYVYFYGTQEDWNSISIGSSNSCLTDATIVYK